MPSSETFRSFGERLQAARTQQGRSLDDIASTIKINRRHLESIEAGDLEKLPQGPYVAAFVREYARSLGLTVPPEFIPPDAGVRPSPRDPKVVSHPVGREEVNFSQVARETARFANTAVKTAVKTVTKTTESVVNLVETGSKEALEVLTSKELWEEADTIRRERLGLPPLERKVEPIKHTPESKKEEPPEEPIVRAPKPSRMRTSKRATNVVIGLLVVFFAVAAYFAIRMSRNESNAVTAKDYVPAPVEKNQPIPVPRKNEVSPTNRTAIVGATAVKDSLRFMLRATQPVWVSIAPDGIPAYRGEMKPGEVRSFRAGQKFVVDIGNQHSVVLTFNGAPLSGLPAIAHSSVVVRDLVLTRDRVSIAGNPVDFHALTTPPVSPAAAVVHSPSVPANAPPSNGGRTLNKKSGNSQAVAKPASPSVHKPNQGTVAKNSSATHTNTTKKPTKSTGKSSQTHRSSKNGAAPQLHPVEPIPPAP